ncbi:MAG: hypothetical protein OHK0029_15970 [Armatimonadaceae bacterium]
MGNTSGRRRFDEYLTLFGFTDEWRNLGIPSDEQIATLLLPELAGDASPQPEQHRWMVFQNFLWENLPLEPEMAHALYTLGENEADPNLGEGIQIEIVALSECPPELVDRAMQSPRKRLARNAAQRRQFENEKKRRETHATTAEPLALPSEPLPISDTSLRDRMKRVNPNFARIYRQRSGE